MLVLKRLAALTAVMMAGLVIGDAVFGGAGFAGKASLAIGADADDVDFRLLRHGEGPFSCFGNCRKLGPPARTKL